MFAIVDSADCVFVSVACRLLAVDCSVLVWKAPRRRLQRDVVDGLVDHRDGRRAPRRRGDVDRGQIGELVARTMPMLAADTLLMASEAVYRRWPRSGTSTCRWRR